MSSGQPLNLGPPGPLTFPGAAPVQIPLRQPGLQMPAPVVPQQAPPLGGGLPPASIAAPGVPAAAPVEIPPLLERPGLPPPGAPTAVFTPGQGFEPTTPAVPPRRIVGPREQEMRRVQAAMQTPPSDPRARVGVPGQGIAVTPASMAMGPGRPPGRPATSGALGALAQQGKRFERQLARANAARQEAAGIEAKAVKQEAAAQKGLLKGQIGLMRAYKTDMMNLQKEQQAAESMRVKAWRDDKAKLDATLEDVATKKIDPNRLNSRLRAVQIGNMIGSAIGALAAAKLGVAGTTYDATAARMMNAMEGEIERDIEAQRQEIDQMKARAVGIRNGLDMMRQQHGDERAAEAALRTAKYDQLERDFRMKAQEVGIQQTDPLLQRQLAEIQTKRAEAMQEFAAVSNENAMKLITAGEDIRNTQMAMRTAELAAMAQQMEAQQKTAQGRELSAANVISMGENNTALLAIDEVDRAFKDLTGEFSGVMQFLPGTDATLYTDKVNVASQVIAKALNKGVLTDADMERTRNFLPTAGDGQRRAQMKLAGLKKLLAAGQKVKISQLGKAGFDVAAFAEEGAELPSTFQAEE